MFTSKWHSFSQNMAWYLLALFLLFMVMRIFPQVVLIWWAVALVGGLALGREFQKLRAIPAEDDIIDEQLEIYLLQARGYQAEIERSMQENQGELGQLGTQLTMWTTAIEHLVKQVNRFWYDDLIRRELNHLPQTITKLETLFTQETDPVKRHQINRNLLQRRKQLRVLELLQLNIRKAEMGIEDTLTLLDRVHHKVTTSPVGHAVAHSLAEDVSAEVKRLSEHIEALNDITLGR